MFTSTQEDDKLNFNYLLRNYEIKWITREQIYYSQLGQEAPMTNKLNQSLFPFLYRDRKKEEKSETNIIHAKQEKEQKDRNQLKDKKRVSANNHEPTIEILHTNN